MKKFLAALVFCLMTSCAMPKERLDIVLHNSGKNTIEVSAGSGPFFKKIRLDPGKKWFGYIPRSFSVNRITITIAVKE